MHVVVIHAVFHLRSDATNMQVESHYPLLALWPCKKKKIPPPLWSLVSFTRKMRVLDEKLLTFHFFLDSPWFCDFCPRPKWCLLVACKLTTSLPRKSLIRCGFPLLVSFQLDDNHKMPALPMWDGVNSLRFAKCFCVISVKAITSPEWERSVPCSCQPSPH